MKDEFEGLKAAGKSIRLTDEEKNEILSVCRRRTAKKRKYGRAIVAAAMLILVLSAVLLPRFNAKKDAMNEKAIYVPSAENQIRYNFDESMNSPCEEAESEDAAFEIPEEFVSLVDEKEYSEWIKTVSCSGEELMIKFAEHFNISYEDFIEANEKFRERSGYEFDAQSIYNEMKGE